MDEQQIKDWLGLANEPRPLKPAIVEGMAEVPWPETDTEHMDVFAAFLMCADDPFQILGIALGDATEVVEEFQRTSVEVDAAGLSQCPTCHSFQAPATPDGRCADPWHDQPHPDIPIPEKETPDADQADPAARDRDAAAPGAPEPPDAL